ERRALLAASLSMLILLVLFALSLLPANTPWAAPADKLPPGQHPLLSSAAPVMQSIVPLIFVFFLVPGVVYGYLSGAFRSHRDVIAGMTKAMGGMGYYVVMAFCAAQFLYAFNQSNLGVLLALKGAKSLQAAGLPIAVTLIGVILLSATVNLLVGSASAKWTLIGAIMVPMMMKLGVSPDLTQAAYRVGDSTTNIITPLLPYFPLIVVFCRRYVKNSGIGTLVALMLPYSITLMVAWTAFLLAFWALDLPLGVGASYTYLPPGG
ncbi:MAG: AbgT family transporter, partial [Anaerolineae bacterium]|nr:AbgT family transporter [Anaerolineae bacterium]